MRFDRPRSLTAAQQYFTLRINPACQGQGRLRGNTLTWRFPVTPMPLSRQYDARIEYRQAKSPEVYIEAPNLVVLANGRKLPHVYDQSPTRLCLYLPGTGEWGAWMRLDQTAVPWTALWLLYFEGWLLTGEWLGGGLHPTAREGSQRPLRTREHTRLSRSAGES